ncbi:MAG: WD40 repeat-like protein [Cirrosporium novae-zelandiae]|nr:MAG: WD40 repeat-like protein [Cirrosporium novae-zelandiae]
MSLKSDSIWAASPSTTRGQPTQLSADSKGERLAYASNKSVFLRSIDNPAISTQYTSHTSQTTVARFAPSGYYVASGDVTGMIRVWDCVGEGATKGEYAIISGRINDIAWDGDSQRIIAVGDGKGRFGHCITADSGNSVGEISGHTSLINSVSIRQQRPLRAATGSDDNSLVFLHGAPFKFNTNLRGNHNNSVYGVAFSPDGSSLVSVGADRKIWLYDGKTGEVKGQIGEGEHKGSIFGVSWSSDSKRFATSSADQTIKIWDAEAGKSVQSWRMGEEGSVSVPDHQVGVVWPAGRSDGLVISLALSGNLNYLSEGDSKPTRVVQGHQKNITSLGSTVDDNNTTIWTGSYEGRVCSWDVTTGLAHTVDGETHSNYVSGITATPEGQGRIYSVGWDDTLRVIDTTAKTFLGTTAKLEVQPKGVSAAKDQVFVATPNGIEIFKDGSKSGELKTKFSPNAISASSGLVAIGGEIIQIYSVSGRSLDLKTEIKGLTSQVSTLALSPNGSLLAAGTSNGKIFLYNSLDGSLVTNRWSAHTARITCISWNKAGTHAISGGLDTNVFVWSVEKPGNRIKALNSHKDGVNGVAWIEGQDTKVVSTGADAAVKVWKVEGLK